VGEKVRIYIKNLRGFTDMIVLNQIYIKKLRGFTDMIVFNQIYAKKSLSTFVNIIGDTGISRAMSAILASEIDKWKLLYTFVSLEESKRNQFNRPVTDQLKQNTSFNSGANMTLENLKPQKGTVIISDSNNPVEVKKSIDPFTASDKREASTSVPIKEKHRYIPVKYNQMADDLSRM